MEQPRRPQLRRIGYVGLMHIDASQADAIRDAFIGVYKQLFERAPEGLPIEGLMIIGHPHETWESALRTIEFAVELNPEQPSVGVMVPYPGTEVAAMAERKREVVMTTRARFGLWLKHVAPEIVDRIAADAVRKRPRD